MVKVPLALPQPQKYATKCARFSGRVGPNDEVHATALKLLARLFGDQFPYLIPLGFVFIVIIIFLLQGLLGFARRWLNR
jgi:hypothetical protein